MNQDHKLLQNLQKVKKEVKVRQKVTKVQKIKEVNHLRLKGVKKAQARKEKVKKEQHRLLHPNQKLHLLKMNQNHQNLAQKIGCMSMKNLVFWFLEFYAIIGMLLKIVMLRMLNLCSGKYESIVKT